MKANQKSCGLGSLDPFSVLKALSQKVSQKSLPVQRKVLHKDGSLFVRDLKVILMERAFA